MHEFEKVKCKRNVWFTYAQLERIQSSACDMASDFKEQHPEYAEAIAGLYYSYKKAVSDDEIYDHLLDGKLNGIQP